MDDDNVIDCEIVGNGKEIVTPLMIKEKEAATKKGKCRERKYWSTIYCEMIYHRQQSPSNNRNNTIFFEDFSFDILEKVKLLNDYLHCKWRSLHQIVICDNKIFYGNNHKDKEYLVHVLKCLSVLLTFSFI